MEELTKFLIIDMSNAESVFELLDIRKESTIPIQIETLCYPFPEVRSKTEEERRKIIKTIEKEPIGHGLKGAEIRMALTKTKLYKILTRMKDLESLILSVEEERLFTAGGIGRGKGGVRIPIFDNIIDETNEAFDEDNVFIPVFNNLKKLKVEYFYDTNDISGILALFPNLEHFSLCYSSTTVGIELLESICESCPKLKTLYIGSEDEYFEEITDEAVLKFLERQSRIEIIDLKSVTCTTGSIFTKLGDFPTLKKFSIESYDGYSAENDIYFGGNPNPSLEFVDIGIGESLNDEQFDKLVTSLKTVAPNLKHLGGFGTLSNEKSKKISELFVNTLEVLVVNSSTLDLIPLCSNLKRVFLEADLGRKHKIPTNLNVTEMVYRCNKHEIYPMLTESFPNLKFIESYGYSRALLDFLLQNNNSWPKLECIELGYSPETLLVERLISQRPTLAVKLGDDVVKIPISPQVFYYEWLVRDSKKKHY